MGENTDRALRNMVASAQLLYRERGERVAMRCALGDAAALCDAIARDIAWETRGRSGKGATTKRGMELHDTAKRCAEAIWNMRSAVVVPSDPTATTAPIGTTQNGI